MRSHISEKDLRLEGKVDADDWDTQGAGGSGDLDLDFSDSEFDDDGSFDFHSEDPECLVRRTALKRSLEESQTDYGLKDLDEDDDEDAPQKNLNWGKHRPTPSEPEKKRHKDTGGPKEKPGVVTENKNQKPDPVSDSSTKQEMGTAPCSIEVKSELARLSGWEYSTSSQQRLERKKLRLDQHRTPDGRARKVFDQGILRKRFSVVLGGSATADCIIDCGTHSFAPTFSGDEGFLCTKSSLMVVAQDSQTTPFHLFLLCDCEQTESSYHGPNAANKCLYLGRYKTKNVKYCISLPYAELDQEKRFKIAELYSSKKLGGVGGFAFDVLRTAEGSVVNVKGKYFLLAWATAETKNEQISSFSNRKQEILAWVEMLLSIKFRIDLTPVEFDSYDEAVYRKLVGFGLAKGEVSLDEFQLGPL